MAAGGNLIPESYGLRRNELAVAAGNRLAVFAYREQAEQGTPAITGLFQTPPSESIIGLTAGDLTGYGVDELVVLTYNGQNSVLRVVNVTKDGLASPLATWTGIQEGWKMPTIDDINGDGSREIWVHSQLQNVRPAVAGVLRIRRMGQPSRWRIPFRAILGPWPFDNTKALAGLCSGWFLEEEFACLGGNRRSSNAPVPEWLPLPRT